MMERDFSCPWDNGGGGQHLSFLFWTLRFPSGPVFDTFPSLWDWGRKALQMFGPQPRGLAKAPSSLPRGMLPWQWQSCSLTWGVFYEPSSYRAPTAIVDLVPFIAVKAYHPGGSCSLKSHCESIGVNAVGSHDTDMHSKCPLTAQWTFRTASSR